MMTLAANRHLLVFCGAVLLGVILAFFQHAQGLVLVLLLCAVLLPPAALAAFVVAYNLPRPLVEVAPVASRTPRRFGSPLALLVVTLAAIAIFVIFPHLDLAIAKAYYVGRNHFAGHNAIGNIGRAIGNITPFVVLAFILVAYVAARRGKKLFYVPSGRDVAFVTLAMVLGPGLIVNLAMKDHLHRPRPVQISQFGGSRDFKPFYKFDGACPKNCSFPSGEASEAFWMLAPASLVPPPWRSGAMVGALAFATLTSVLRLAFGGHFLSDIVFAALIMWGLLMALRFVIYERDKLG